MSEVVVKKYVVRLTAEERTQLEEVISKGKRPATMILKARILLKAGHVRCRRGLERWSHRESPQHQSRHRSPDPPVFG